MIKKILFTTESTREKTKTFTTESTESTEERQEKKHFIFKDILFLVHKSSLAFSITLHVFSLYFSVFLCALCGESVLYFGYIVMEAIIL
jgi:hypothetical protein